MAAKAQAQADAWEPSIGDDKVKAATGRGWMGWFKSQIGLQVNKLPDDGAVEKERAAWKSTLLNFQKLLEKA